MAKKHNKNKKTFEKEKKRFLRFTLPEEIKKWIWGVCLTILAIIIALSFFDLAGPAGKAMMSGFLFLIGKAVFILPLILVLAGLVFLITKRKKVLGIEFLAISILIFGAAGLLECLTPDLKQGGWLGYVFTWPFLKFFGILVTQIISGGIILIGILIFWHLLGPSIKEEKPDEEKKQGLIKKIFAPKFKVKEIEPVPTAPERENKIIEKPLEIKAKPIGKYNLPGLDLLEKEKEMPSAGDIRVNSAIIKKTLENFDIPVEMSQISIGPTVTQYSLKPAEGIKLTKITTLSNDLSLALAAHPIRIEAPIPGKPLVGIEVPNRARARVRLRDLIANNNFFQGSCLNFALGKDVSGNMMYADLARMPHLLVAGATGTGKTIFLNTLLLSFLYRNSPEQLRLILVDPKRVEFPVYKDLPHLLCPVIFDAQKTINALKWLVSEMERRFDLLAAAKTRDIESYNQDRAKAEEEPLPYIVLVIDELADLMAARGREIEGAVVRLAQMARAVGIHLIVATQRPSVEVITGLIKANITARITFQVASQVDSRTILDMAGAEKLLGLGDLLFISAQLTKPKRIQGPFVSEKEVRRVVQYIKNQNPQLKDKEDEEGFLENHLAEDLEKSLETTVEGESADFYQGEDPLYEEAKRIVIESKKASASLLQRRLRLGYARAARLIDMLENKGIVGPGDGAKPREILIKTEEEDEWQKV
ncbi:DNA translocase FtsK [Candidatus Parcubacteria bacterium]|nr:DNA translocase FtsK [Candidatus Parcubacteria bacterium]